jgi:chemotaxis protein MotB
MLRRPPKDQENHARWLVSYADFITLLFALFVLMFAGAQSDKQKARAVSQAVRKALEHEPAGAVTGARVRNAAPAVRQDSPADLAKSLETLRAGLASEIESSKIAMRLEGRGLIVSLRESAFFASGDDGVSPSSVPIFAKLAAVVRVLPNRVRLEGYTDSVPIHNARFRSNWDLSAARAIAVMELLRDRFGIPVQRLAVAGYGENAPVDSNETESGRAHNRRVDLVVLSAEGEKGEPDRERR